MAGTDGETGYREFEEKVADVFRQREWYVNHLPPGKDAGVDIELKKKNVSAGVQVKRYTDSKVSRSEVQQYAGAKMEHGYDEFYLVTSSEFTEPAQKAAKNVDVELINGDEFVAMANQSNQLSIPVIKHRILSTGSLIVKDILKTLEPLSKGKQFKMAILFCVFLMVGGLTGDSSVSIFYFGSIAAVVLLITRAHSGE